MPDFGRDLAMSTAFTGGGSPLERTLPLTEYRDLTDLGAGLYYLKLQSTGQLPVESETSLLGFDA